MTAPAAPSWAAVGATVLIRQSVPGSMEDTCQVATVERHTATQIVAATTKGTYYRFRIADLGGVGETTYGPRSTLVDPSTPQGKELLASGRRQARRSQLRDAADRWRGLGRSGSGRDRVNGGTLTPEAHLEQELALLTELERAVAALRATLVHS